MNTVFLGLGSNMGDRKANLWQALSMLTPHVVPHEMSSLYESEPFGAPKQPRFYNMALRASTELEPHILLAFVKEIERLLGRESDTHNMPRPIDIDILLYGDSVVESPELAIPHRGMHERAFVLVPLEEIASSEVHPKLRRPVIDLLDELGGYDEEVWLAEEQL